ncbi:MAG: 2-ketoisovalerate ferredoxin oxidoreductase [Candidatus Cloacimonadota bacterium]|nr:MAG: 2-ketoisovalerate ferredoxin oxidoreductase [Candidatus Cloacimonadota bacterium]
MAKGKIIYKRAKDIPLNAMSVGSMLFNKTGAWRNVKPIIDYDNCIKCMICWKFCPDICIVIEDENPVIDYDYCKGCAVCVVECPKKCISLVEEGR